MSDICNRSRMKLSVEEVRDGQTADLSSRGLLSLDAETAQSAKKQLKTAVKLGFANIFDRFTKDVAFALRAAERGLTRAAMLVQDVLASAVLPNPFRNTEQRTISVGSQASMTYGAGSTAAATARLLRSAPQGWAGFIVGRLPHCRVLARGRILAERVCQHHCSHEPCEPPCDVRTGRRDRRPDSPPFERNRDSAVQYLRHLVDAAIAAAERTARKQEENAKRSQQAQPKYSEPYPAKGRGKGSGGSQASSTCPGQAEALLIVRLVWTLPGVRPGLAWTLVRVSGGRRFALVAYSGAISNQ